ncbi:hypothetical protein VDGL01_09779 [Verticillium dahliae]
MRQDKARQGKGVTAKYHGTWHGWFQAHHTNAASPKGCGRSRMIVELISCTCEKRPASAVSCWSGGKPTKPRARERRRERQTVCMWYLHQCVFLSLSHTRIHAAQLPRHFACPIFFVGIRDLCVSGNIFREPSPRDTLPTNRRSTCLAVEMPVVEQPPITQGSR